MYLPQWEEELPILHDWDSIYGSIVLFKKLSSSFFKRVGSSTYLCSVWRWNLKLQSKLPWTTIESTSAQCCVQFPLHFYYQGIFFIFLWLSCIEEDNYVLSSISAICLSLSAQYAILLKALRIFPFYLLSTKGKGR